MDLKGAQITPNLPLRFSSTIFFPGKNFSSLFISHQRFCFVITYCNPEFQTRVIGACMDLTPWLQALYSSAVLCDPSMAWQHSSTMRLQFLARNDTRCTVRIDHVIEHRWPYARKKRALHGIGGVVLVQYKQKPDPSTGGQSHVASRSTRGGRGGVSISAGVTGTTANQIAVDRSRSRPRSRAIIYNSACARPAAFITARGPRERVTSRAGLENRTTWSRAVVTDRQPASSVSLAP
jgi:hypothetical protein